MSYPSSRGPPYYLLVPSDTPLVLVRLVPFPDSAVAPRALSRVAAASERGKPPDDHHHHPSLLTDFSQLRSSIFFLFVPFGVFVAGDWGSGASPLNILAAAAACLFFLFSLSLLADFAATFV